MVDPLTGYDDEQDRVDREDERIRDERWAEFVAHLRQFQLGENATTLGVAHAFRHWPDALKEHERRMLDFSESEGWDGVLNAIARAYREEQKES